MPLLSPSVEYAKFFGDDFEQRHPELFQCPEQYVDPKIAWTLVREIENLNKAYHSLSRVRNRGPENLNMTAEQFGQRQMLMDLSRQIILGERNRLTNIFVALLRGEPVTWKENDF